MAISVNKRLIGGFAAAILLVFTVATVSFFTLRNQFQVNKDVRTIYQRMEQVDRISQLMIDMETGRRAFRATNEKRFLSPYLSALKQIDRAVQDLQVMVNANRDLAPKAEMLKRDIGAMKNFWDSLGFDASKNTREIIIRITDKEKIFMDMVRTDIDVIQKFNYVNLTGAESRSGQAVYEASWVLTTGIILILIIVSVLLYFIFKEFNNRRKAETHLTFSNKQLELINKQLERFGYIVAHDLKSPLASMIMLMEILQNNPSVSENPETKRNVEMMVDSGFHLSSMIDAILKYSKESIQQQAIEGVDVNSLVNQIMAVLSPGDNVEVKCGKLPFLHTRRIKLQQVLQNLISNAIKYNDKEKTIIEISAEDEGDFYRFAVKDNGAGINTQDQKRLFHLFQANEKNYGKVDSSTGVGLNLLKILVEEQGGNIWVESSPGTGSTFYFQWRK